MTHRLRGRPLLSFCHQQPQVATGRSSQLTLLRPARLVLRKWPRQASCLRRVHIRSDGNYCRMGVCTPSCIMFNTIRPRRYEVRCFIPRTSCDVASHSSSDPVSNVAASLSKQGTALYHICKDNHRNPKSTAGLLLRASDIVPDSRVRTCREEN